jgi:thimet oligopeptidase
MKYHNILESVSFAALLCASSVATAQSYEPASDGLLLDLQLTPADASAVKAMCNERLEAAAQLRSNLEAMPVTTDPQMLFAAYDDLYNILASTAYTEALLLQNVHGDTDIRKAGAECQALASDAITEMTLSKPLFDRLNAVQAANEDPAMDWTLVRQVESFRRGGVDKDDATRAKVGGLLKEITATSIEFDENIAKDVRYLTVDAKDLAGLPDDFLAQYKLDADGKISLPVTGATLSPILRYGESADLRKRMLTEFSSRAYPQNDTILARLIAQRAEFAEAMGYPNFAAFDFANKMAKDTETIQSFIDDIAAASRPIAEQEVGRLLGRLQQDDPSLAELDQWSTSRASTLIRTEEYATDPKVIREYFTYAKVRSGIFQLTEDLFGISIRPWKTGLWSDEAESYEIVENREVIGRFYLDMHPRDGKFTHAAMFPVRIGIKGRQVPIAALVTNFPDGLMEHSQVETFLHEFGHLLHWIFAGKVEHATQNFSELESDVTEAPSTLLEEWVWDYDTLKKFASNDKGEVIPEELVKKMNAGRNFGKALGTMGQLGSAATSFDFYSKPMIGKDLGEVENAAVARYYPLKPVPDTHRYASFGHLTGYAASYYTYQWSEALASDLMSRFRAAGLRDKATANDYRNMILAPGGSASMNDLARKFLGRDWSVNSYREDLKRGARE